MSKSQQYIIDGITYKKDGWFGSQLVSFENGKQIGDTRILDDKYLMYVYMVHNHWFKKNHVHWCIFSKKIEIDSDVIRKFYEDLG